MLFFTFDNNCNLQLNRENINMIPTINSEKRKCKIQITELYTIICSVIDDNKQERIIQCKLFFIETNERLYISSL